ncbi:MAG: zinc ribbon domain-containing protein [Acidaminococcaceae bacterium]|nr:zinc ribbon domain-containing protein [Acidaminococcaceae bacterium]
MMKTFSKSIAKLTILTILFCLFSLPCFAELRRVPAASIVEQGLTAITVDAEGAEDFRYVGLKDKRHTYVGKIKPESKIKFVISGSLKSAKELPITGRTNLIRLQVTVKKGDTVIKTENFRKENVNSVFLNYTVPKDADTLEVIELFALTNKSKDSKFNQKVTTVNKLVLSAREDVLAAVAGQPVTTDSSDKKATPDTDGKKTKVDANKNKEGSGKNTGKTDGKNGKGTEESPEAEAAKRFTRIVSGIAFLVFLAGIGFHFFLKNKKSNRIASDRLARKEQLRLQAIERQKQLKQNSQQEETQEEWQEEIQRTDGPTEDTLPPDNPQHAIPQAGEPNASAATGAAQTSYCQNCGAPLKANSKFCENCGSKV